MLNTYVVGIRELGGRTESQHLIIVYTKADRVADRFVNPWDDLLAYLLEGSVASLARPDGYMERMDYTSKKLYKFTKDVLHAHEFLNIADAHFKSISFSIISALGAQPDGAHLPVNIVPRRILDPLLWTMEKSFSGPSWLLRRWWGW